MAKLRFRQLVLDALGKSKMSVRLAQPKTSLESIANILVADAAAGKAMPMRLLLSLLDAEIAECETMPDADETDCEQQTTAAEPPDNTTM